MNPETNNESMNNMNSQSVNTNTIPQTQTQEQQTVPVSGTQSTQTNSNNKYYTIIGAVVATVIIAGAIFMGYGFYLNKQKTMTSDSSSQITQTTFISEEKDFQIAFPGVPLRKIETIPLEDGVILDMMTYNMRLNGSEYLVAGIDYSKKGITFKDSDPKEILNGAVNGSAEESKTKIDSLVYGQVEGNSSVDAVFSNDSILIHSRMILINDSLYQIIVSQEKNKADDTYKDFINSFKYLDTTNKNNMDVTISLLGDNYKKGFTLPANSGSDYTSEGYEWVKGNETVNDWKTLITTFKLTPLSADKPLSAEVYAQNVASLNTDKGAVILETSVINTEDAKKEGVDISNPPYLLIYAFPREKETDPIELNIQKIENLKGGEVGIFIYAERLEKTSSEDIKTYLSSDVFYKKRMAVILQKFLY